MSSPLRRTVGALLTLLAFAFVVGIPGTAHAEDGYRYWNYSHLAGDTFEFAQSGPGDFTPKDGDVEGWRYGTSTVSQGIFPRADLGKVTFDAVCGNAEAAEGEKRVAVLIDFGIEADAEGAEVPEPRAECAVVPADANGQQVLESVVDVRTQGCGDPVADAQVSGDEQTVAFALPAAEEETQPAAAEEDGGVSWPLVAVIAVVVLLAALAVPLYRRNREA